MNKQKSTYKAPKMEVIPLQNQTDLLCSSDPNCIILGYNENPVDLSSCRKDDLV